MGWMRDLGLIKAPDPGSGSATLVGSDKVLLVPGQGSWLYVGNG